MKKSSTFRIQGLFKTTSKIQYLFKIERKMFVLEFETPTNKKLWIKKLLAVICHFNTQKYNNLLSQARSSRLLFEF